MSIYKVFLNSDTKEQSGWVVVVSMGKKNSISQKHFTKSRYDDNIHTAYIYAKKWEKKKQQESTDIRNFRRLFDYNQKDNLHISSNFSINFQKRKYIKKDTTQLVLLPYIEIGIFDEHKKIKHGLASGNYHSKYKLLVKLYLERLHLTSWKFNLYEEYLLEKMPSIDEINSAGATKAVQNKLYYIGIIRDK